MRALIHQPGLSGGQSGQPTGLGNRFRRGLVALLLAAPSVTWALSIDEARHLLERTGFGAAPHEMEKLLPMNRAEAVDHIVAGLSNDAPVVELPAFLKQPIKDDYLRRLGEYPPASMLPKGVRLKSYDQMARDAYFNIGENEFVQLRMWWMDQMISTRTPQAERLALFWHNHFAVSYFTVLVPGYMNGYMQTLRHWGGRDFGGLLNAMMHDPAMLVYLDNSVNTKAVPNENFARELLELFTLGLGHYTQQDIKEVARSLAGMSLDFGGSWKYLYRADAADTGEKTVLGQTGPWKGADILRILLEHPRTAEFLAEKFYREYVSLEVNKLEVKRLATVLRQERYAIAPFMRSLLMSDAFWASNNRGSLVKSPIEMVVGFSRTFGLSMPDVEMIDSFAAMLYQELLNVPSVAGWKGGEAWLTHTGLVHRKEIVEKLWTSLEDTQRLATAGPNDLLVRLSGEIPRDKVSISYSIWVDGKPVHKGEVRHPKNMGEGGANSPKPTWETVVVPRGQLVSKPSKVEVRFDKAMPDTALFVNWIQLDGRRLSAYMAKQTRGVEAPCNTPVGMMYCGSALTFNMRSALPPGALASLQDRSYPDVNSHIEYSTSRQPLTLRPAGLSRQEAAQPVQERFAALLDAARRQGRDAGPVWQAVLSVPPLQTPLQTEVGSLQALRLLTLDETFSIR